MTNSPIFKNAIRNTPVKALTANGAITNASSLDPLVDLFFVIGSARNMSDAQLFPMFEKALAEDKVNTLKMLFWARDIRGGSGERKTFVRLFNYLYKHYDYEMDAISLIGLIPTFGRFKDLIESLPPEVAAAFLLKGISAKNGLAAKWSPRKGPVFNDMRKILNVTPKALRKALVELTKVVETQMCAKQWDQIIFDHVPSVAAARYQKAFSKHQPERYKAYRDALNSKDPAVKATAKINASAIFPHDVLKSLHLGDAGVATAQWEALPDYLGDNKIIPVCDVSGSMTCQVGGNPNLRCIDICVSLGLYIADKQKGAFKDIFCTFSSKPSLEVLKGNIAQKVRQLNAAHWEMSTNVEGAFRAILKMAVENKVPASDMPKMLLIFSDMEFNPSTVSGLTNQQVAEGYFKAAGYKLPKIVYWNLNARPGNNPVTIREDGVCLVSGFSPSILKAILAGSEAIEDDFSPRAIMMKTLNDPRYAVVEELLKK